MRRFTGRWPGGLSLHQPVCFICANVLLILAAFSRLTGDVSRSAFVAGLFAVHPLHVESVAWIAERKDVLEPVSSASASLNAYVAYAGIGAAAGWHVPGSCFVLSLLAKQTLVTLPFVLALARFRQLGRMRVDAIASS